MPQLSLVLFALLCGIAAGCRSNRPVPADAAARHPRVRADAQFLHQYAATRRFSAGTPTGVTIVPDGSAVLFLRSQPRSNVQDLYEFNTATGQERLLLTAQQILQGGEEKLSPEEKARRERMRLSVRGIAGYKLSKDGTKILVPLSGELFIVERATGDVTLLTNPDLVAGADDEQKKGYPLDPQFSPDGKHVVVVRNNELCVIDAASGRERQLTTGAGGTISHATAEFVAQEEMGRRSGYWWSPDSTRLVYQRTDESPVEQLYIMDASRPEIAPQAWRYPRAGKDNAEVTLGIISREGGDTTWIDWDRGTYPYVTTVKWPDNAPLTILVQNREQTEELLLRVDENSGSTTPLLAERDPAWVNIDQSMPKWFKDGSAFLWTTERNGTWQLELRDRQGQLVRLLTATDFRYKDFVHLDEARGVVYTSGGEDPTQTHLFRVRLDGAGSPQQISVEPGIHSASFGANDEIFYHTRSLLSGGRMRTIERIDGKILGVLRSVAEEPPFVPNLEITKVDADPGMYAAIIRPRAFDPAHRYPVINSVYGGPHGQTVRADPLSYLLQQWIADHGFIVVSIDGRGTPSRGRDWERVIKGNLIDIPLDDQANAIRALAAQYPEMDIDRVGIYGWSFGGYFAAMAVMRRPDVFKAAVAGAPVADWLDYDTHYTERYMGLPEANTEGYKASSVLAYCAQLERPLLIIHGTADDNVYFVHSLKMSNELFRHGREHDFLVLSDFTHMVSDPLVTTRLYQRIFEFLARGLATPPFAARTGASLGPRTATKGKYPLVRESFFEPKPREDGYVTALRWGTDAIGARTPSPTNWCGNSLPHRSMRSLM